MKLARAAAVLAVASLLLGSACADTKSAERDAATKVKALPPAAMPAELLGLTVAPEQVHELSDAANAYVDQAALFGLRKGELLEATFQISRFNSHAQPQDPKFRQRVLANVGGSLARKARMGDDEVYFTSAAKQVIAVWFRGRSLFIMSIREDFPFPRTLVRAGLEVQR
jgi:hypothetical protein